MSELADFLVTNPGGIAILCLVVVFHPLIIEALIVFVSWCNKIRNRAKDETYRNIQRAKREAI